MGLATSCSNSSEKEISQNQESGNYQFPDKLPSYREKIKTTFSEGSVLGSNDRVVLALIGAGGWGTNLILNVVLVTFWIKNDLPGPHAALAIATSLSAFLNAFLLYKGLRKAGVLSLLPGWRRLLLQLLVANAVMGMLLVEFSPPLDAWYQVGTLTRCLWLALAVAGGAAELA